MTENNIIEDKSQDFALRIVNLYKHLTLRDNNKEYIMSKQLLRCGTSIGANVAEAECAISKDDFIAKIYISLKECNETKYWLKLLYKSDYINKNEFESIYNDCLELLRILTSITKSTRPRQ